MPRAPDLSGFALDDRYELSAVLGEGTFGRVYRGWDRRLERFVAVKVVKPWWAEDPDWARSFEREAQLLARISHPGIVQIFDVGQADEGLYYVSELVDGESLADRLTRGPLDPWTATAIAEQLARALAQAHAQRIVHRDVKPANILLAADGHVKVGDFGVARLAEGTTDGANATIVGTPRYMAPEQARGWRITPATDVYSVGIVLYEMLTGRPPFTERAAVELALRHLNDPPPPLPASVPVPVAALVKRALAKDPGDRYADGAQIADALAGALRSAPAGARRTPAPTRDRVRPRRRPSHLPSRPRTLVPAGSSGHPGESGPPGPPGPRPPDPRSRPGGAAPPRALPPASDRPVEATRQAPKFGPRRNLNPSARRRSIAALGLAFALLSAMIVGALVLGATGHVRVPRLLALNASQVRARARRLALQPEFTRRYAHVAPGTVIGQRPRPGARVDQGSTVHVILSAGPPPVEVPELAGEQLATAQANLARIGLTARATRIVAPGVPAGTVTSQLPAPGTELTPSHSVALNVAEVPHWQPVTSLTGSGQTSAAQFHIRGTRWRIVYTMGYQGTCTFIFWCSGPGADVENTASGSSVSSFGLSDGGRQVREFDTGPGDYRLRISPGSDTARWSAWVEDYY
jgi:serine/threonine protein kinase